MAEFVYVDNSNVFIEGQRVSAISKGMALDAYDAMKNGTLDYSYRMDFGKLYEFLLGHDSSQVGRAVLFGSRPPANDSFWSMPRRAGFEVKLEDRNVSNKEKKIDTGIVAAMMRDAYTKTNKETDVLTLVSGDGDYVPAVQQLKDDGFEVKVAFWSHASRELKAVCSEFISLDSYLSHLSVPMG